MNRHRRQQLTWLLLGTGLTIARSATAQPTARGVWTMYGGDHAISQRLALTVDAQLRFGGQEPISRTTLIRPGIALALHPRVRVSGGYAWSRQDPEDAGVASTLEHRLWQGVQLSQQLRGATVSHRLRLEQRFVDHAASPTESGGWAASGRARYQLRTTVPVTSTRGSYLALADEVFMGFGGAAGAPALDQNRAHVAIGTRIGRTTRLETGYLHQTTRTAADRLVARTHILTLSIQSSASFVHRERRD